MKLPNGSTLRMKWGSSVVSHRKVCKHHQNWAYSQKYVWGWEEVKQKLNPLEPRSLACTLLWRAAQPRFQERSPQSPTALLPGLSGCHQPGPLASGHFLLHLFFQCCHVHSLHGFRSSGKPGIFRSRCITPMSTCNSEQELQAQGSVAWRDVLLSDPEQISCLSATKKQGKSEDTFSSQSTFCIYSPSGLQLNPGSQLNSDSRARGK